MEPVVSDRRAPAVQRLPEQRRGSFTVAQHSFSFDDPFVDEDLPRITAEVRELERIAAEFYGEDAGRHRRRLSKIDLANPATARWIGFAPSTEHWLSTIPTAAALDVLYDPNSGAYPSGVPMDEGSRSIFRNVADAQGIRSRAAVMRAVLLEQAMAAPHPLRWLSLACGAAQPVIATMAEIARRADAGAPNAVLADADTQALRLASRYADEHDLRHHTEIVKANVLDRHGFRKWEGKFDAVDAVGLLEYLKPQNWSYTYRGVIHSRRTMAGAETFLRNAYACVKPGGMLVVGNMLDTHPQLGFTMDVVQWPHIQPRSIGEMLDIYEGAGLFGHVDVYLPTDGVYAVYVVRKPTRP